MFKEKNWSDLKIREWWGNKCYKWVTILAEDSLVSVLFVLANMTANPDSDFAQPL